MSLGILTLLAGMLGFVTGLVATAHYVANAPPSDRWLFIVGFGESLQNMSLALLLSTIAAALATVGAFRVAVAEDEGREARG